MPSTVGQACSGKTNLLFVTAFRRFARFRPDESGYYKLLVMVLMLAKQHVLLVTFGVHECDEVKDFFA